MTTLDENFDAAIDRFARFLGSDSKPMTIGWVLRDDLVWWRKTAYVLTPLPSENVAVVKRLYECELARRHGVEFSALFFFANWACCTLWVPRTSVEAEYRRLSGLKLSKPVDAPPAREIGNIFTWKVLRILERRSRGINQFDSSGVIRKRDMVQFGVSNPSIESWD